MTDASARRESVLRLAWPLVLSFWMRSLFSFVDTGFAATLGDEAVAAIGLSFPLDFLMIACWVGTSTGVTSLLSQAMGAHQGERIEQVLRVTRRFVAVLIPTFCAIGVAVWFVTPLLVRESPDASGLAPEVARQFRIYGTVLAIGSAFTSFWSVIPDSIIKAHQDTRSTMWAGIWSNLLNVSLNALFLFVFHWGIFGIALSTVLGRLGGLAYALVRARHHERKRLAAGLDTVPGVDARPVRAMLVLAVPAALSFMLVSLETTLVNAILAAGDTATEAIAAYAIYYRYVLFFAMPIVATGVALLPFTGRLWGRRDIAGIRRAGLETALAGLAYCLVIVTPVVLLFAEALVLPFAEAERTTELAAFSLLVVPLSCLVSIPFFACRPIFEGMQRGLPGLVMSLLRYVVLTAPCVLLGKHLALEWGYSSFHGVIVGLGVATAVPAAIFAAWTVVALRRVEGEAQE